MTEAFRVCLKAILRRPRAGGMRRRSHALINPRTRDADLPIEVLQAGDQPGRAARCVPRLHPACAPRAEVGRPALPEAYPGWMIARQGIDRRGQV